MFVSGIYRAADTDRKRRSLMHPEHEYPEKKQRELTDAEKAQLRERINAGDDDYAKLAREFGCSTSQVAGIKATMHRK